MSCRVWMWSILMENVLNYRQFFRNCKNTFSLDTDQTDYYAISSDSLQDKDEFAKPK
jgi:hypothetical protein